MQIQNFAIHNNNKMFQTWGCEHPESSISAVFQHEYCNNLDFIHESITEIRIFLLMVLA